MLTPLAEEGPGWFVARVVSLGTSGVRGKFPDANARVVNLNLEGLGGSWFPWTRAGMLSHTGPRVDAVRNGF